MHFVINDNNIYSEINFHMHMLSFDTFSDLRIGKEGLGGSKSEYVLQTLCFLVKQQNKLRSGF